MKSDKSSSELWPGIMFCVGIAVVSFVTWMAYKPISSLMWAFIYSIVIANVVRVPDKLMAGINFCARDFLRGVIASLGIVSSALIWLRVGVGVINALIIIFVSLFLGIWLGRKLGLEGRLATLIGVGTAICGASAIAATGPAIKAREEEIGLSLACITLFGLLAMFTYPFLYMNTMVGDLLMHNINVYSIWCGSGVHETAQVIAAAGVIGSEVIGPALLVKSVRIFMIGPIILVATYILSRMERGTVDKPVTKVTLPVYGVVFIINSIFCALLDAYAVQVATLGFDWLSVKKVLSSNILPFLLATCFAGVGSKVRLASIAKLGAKPFLFGAFMAVLAGVLALVLAVAVAPFVPPAT